jgi:ABC-type uncharacterized transport system fused permease/ATPase subunit
MQPLQPLQPQPTGQPAALDSWGAGGKHTLAATRGILNSLVQCVPAAAAAAGAQQRLALEWREWMTAHLLKQYFADRSFYQLQAGAIVDNPDQRIAADVR